MYLSLSTDFGCRVLTEGLDIALRVLDLTLAEVEAGPPGADQLEILLTLLMLRSMVSLLTTLVSQQPSADRAVCLLLNASFKK